ncbi:MAG TPA: phage holin family protein [Rhodopseudomonas sp.]|uniref:phage holin family protein n=1 Tax=Rhodopseudomonas sp. TaxID=1078 RepID=UPI002EDA88D0
MSSPANRSIPELFSDAFGQLAKLLSNEIDLARAEFSQKLGQVGRAGAMIGAGAVIFMPALVLILFAIAAALAQAGFSPAMSYLITGGGAAVIALILISIGISRLSGDALKPTVMMQEIERDKLAAKEMVQ